MNRLTWIPVLVFTTCTLFFARPITDPPCAAQTLDASKLFGPPGPGVQQANDLQGIQKNAAILLPTMPGTFMKIETDDSGEVRLGNAVSVGAGLMLAIGKATNNGATMDLAPWFIAGLGLSAGIKEDLSSKIKGSTAITVFFGFKNLAFSHSWDIIDGTGYWGISTTLNLFTDLAPDLYIPL